MKYKLAEYATEYGTQIVLHASTTSGYTRVSEYLEVEFVRLSEETINNSKLNALEESISLAKGRASKTLEELKRQKKELLALTCLAI